MGRFEVFKYFTPIAFVGGTATVTLINNDEIKKVRGIFLIKPRPALIPGKGLIGGKIHLTPFVGIAVFYLPAGISEWGKYLVLGIINKDVAVCKIQYLWTTVFSCSVPSGIP